VFHRSISGVSRPAARKRPSAAHIHKDTPFEQLDKGSAAPQYSRVGGEIKFEHRAFDPSDTVRGFELEREQSFATLRPRRCLEGH
jgi:hypothetical protein